MYVPCIQYMTTAQCPPHQTLPVQMFMSTFLVSVVYFFIFKEGWYFLKAYKQKHILGLWLAGTVTFTVYVYCICRINFTIRASD